MKNHLLLFLILITSSNFIFAQHLINLNQCIFTDDDKHIAEKKLNLFASKSGLPISDLIVDIGLSFQRTPYVVASLENGLEEKLVINLRGLDCTTFAESCLALARTVKLGKRDFESYISELERLRYRDGIRDQYPSRLHYFSEWVHNNRTKGIIDDTANENGIKSDKLINYMSTHPSNYPGFKKHPELIPTISQQEKKISATRFMYFPKNKIQKLIKKLKQSNKITFTINI